MRAFEAGAATCARTARGWRLCIPPVDGSTYAGAQIDDYGRGPGLHFRHRAPARMQIRARFSHRRMTGTSGFGFWNHPFGPRGEVLSAPRSVWFFNASSESRLLTGPNAAGAGFQAASLNAAPWLPGLPRWLWRAAGAAATLALKVPGVPRLAMAATQATSAASEHVLDLDALDITDWHDYAVDWQADHATFFVDGAECHTAVRPARAALGFVCWVDNYFAVAADGRYEFGHLRCDHEQWLEVCDLLVA